MLKKAFLSACCFAAFVGLPGVAAAQTASQTSTSTPLNFNQEPPKPNNNRPKFVGPLASVGQTLADAGVHLNVTYRDTFADAGTQGLTHWATANLGKLRIDGDFDLGKMIGLQGGSLLVAETIHMFRENNYQYLSLVGDDAGNAMIGNHKPVNALSVLAYQQKLFNDRLEVEFGRFNPSYDFDPNICEQGPICAMNIAKFTGGFLPVDYGQLGAVARVKLPDDFFVKLGEFEAIPPYGFKTGVNFLLSGSTGALTLAQVGYATSRSAEYPGTYMLTVFQNSSKFTDPVNSKLSRWGTEAIMADALQTVWRSGPGPVPAHHLDVYAKLGATPDPYQDFSTEVDSGVNFFGIFPGRPFDAIGVKVSYFRVGSDALAAQEAARVKLGGLHEETPPNEFRFELMSTIDLYRRLTITPDFMYIKNPDDFSGKSAAMPTNGFEFTVSLAVPIGSLLGLAPQSED